LKIVFDQRPFGVRQVTRVSHSLSSKKKYLTLIDIFLSDRFLKVLLAVANIVGEVVVLGLQGIVILFLDLPVGTAASNYFGNVASAIS
jgi:hypothetical protein